MDPITNGPAGDPSRYRASQLPDHHFAAHDDDVLGAMASWAALSEVPWKPDVAPGVTQRLAQDAMAYPDLFGPGSRLRSSPTHKIAAPSTDEVHPPARAHWGGGLATGVAGLVLVVAIVGASMSIWTPASTDPSASGSSSALGLGVEPTRPAPVAAEGEARSAGDPRATVAGVGRAASQPALTIVGIGPMRAGGLGARVALHWSPGGGVGLVGETQLQRKTRGGTWIAIASADAGSPMETDLVAGKRYNLRVRSLDEAGNVLDSRRLRVILASRDWASSRIERTPGDWSTTNGGSRLGGALASISADAAISTEFSGASVALLAPIGPTGGAMRVRIDGGDWVRGDLRDLQPADRALVFSQDLENGTHTLDIAVDEGTIALDSMLFVRTPTAWAGRS